MHERGRIAGVVLAAGGSRRLGRAKQLLPFRGEPLVRRAARRARATCDDVYVVVGADGDLVTRALDGLSVNVVVNDAWPEGMGGSVARGTRAAVASSVDLAGLLVTLVDQPLVGSDHLAALIARFRSTNAPAVAAFYDGVVGAPAVFGRTVFDELSALRGAGGARHVLAKLSHEVVRFDLPDAAFDIDVEEDYAALR